MNKIRILYTLSELVYGSKVRQLLDLVKEIDKNRFDVEIGTYYINDEASSDILSLGVPIKQIWLHPPRQFEVDRIVNFVKSLYKIYNKYDIIHSLHYSSLFYEPLIARLGQVQYIYTKTNLKWDNHPLNWKLKSALSNNIIAISSQVNELMIKKGFKEKTLLLPVGIDVDYFKPSSIMKSKVRDQNNIPAGSFVFGCAAQFIETKKQDLVIQAYYELSKKYNNIYLVMCGPNINNEYYREITQAVKEYGISSSVKFLGIVKDMREFYNIIDCFVLPSTDEALGLVYLEAMSSCVPVIGCDDTGAKDIIHGDCGLLVGKNKLKDIVISMESYLMKKEEIPKIGEKCRKLVTEKFNNKRIVRAHEEIYLSLMSSRKIKRVNRKD